MEHVGLFHPTMTDYLLGPSASSAGYAIDAQAAHRAMVKAIEALAPASTSRPDDPLQRYAFLREADHLWATGDHVETFVCLLDRQSNIPRKTSNAADWVFPGSGIDSTRTTRACWV